MLLTGFEPRVMVFLRPTLSQLSHPVIPSAKLKAAIEQMLKPVLVAEVCRIRVGTTTSHDHHLASQKNILQDTIRVGRRRGREKKRWEDNTKEWTELEFANSQRAVENRKR